MIPASAFKLTTSCTYVCPSLVTYVAQSWKELVFIDSLTALPALDFLTNPTRVLFVFCSYSGSVFFSALGIFSTPGTFGFRCVVPTATIFTVWSKHHVNFSHSTMKVNLDGDTED